MLQSVTANSPLTLINRKKSKDWSSNESTKTDNPELLNTLRIFPLQRQLSGQRKFPAHQLNRKKSKNETSAAANANAYFTNDRSFGLVFDFFHRDIAPFLAATGSSDSACFKYNSASTVSLPLQDHVKESHTTEDANRCPICRGLYPDKEVLEKHIPLHEGKHRLQCVECNTVFTRSNGLMRHMSIHTGEKVDGYMKFNVRLSNKKLIFLPFQVPHMRHMRQRIHLSVVVQASFVGSW